jgi:hypothetical protein
VLTTSLMIGRSARPRQRTPSSGATATSVRIHDATLVTFDRSMSLPSWYNRITRSSHILMWDFSVQRCSCTRTRTRTPKQSSPSSSSPR